MLKPAPSSPCDGCCHPISRSRLRESDRAALRDVFDAISALGGEDTGPTGFAAGVSRLGQALADAGFPLHVAEVVETWRARARGRWVPAASVFPWASQAGTWLVRVEGDHVVEVFGTPGDWTAWVDRHEDRDGFATRGEAQAWALGRPRQPVAGRRVA